MIYIKPLMRKFNQHFRNKRPLITGAKINTFIYMTTINERILLIIKDFCDGNKAEFARTMGELPQTINGWLRREVGLNVLNKISEKFPDVNKSWLLTGEGSMLVEDSLVPESIQVDEVKTTREELLKVIAELSEANNKLSAANERYSRIIDRLLEEKEAMSV